MRSVIALIVLMMILSACGETSSTIAYDALPSTGDIANGEILFTAQTCNACHLEGASGAPYLEGFAERAGTVVEGQSAREYAFYSIVEPAQHIAEGYGNAMPNHYDERMTSQEIADLVAYLLSL
ncbi:MAG: c-type cytochrome [Phototrophicaceae bacterium]